MAYNLIGKDFTPPDIHAKVTGKAKYAEDFRADGMVFIKTYPSPMPHAEIKSIDVSKAKKMPGVVGVLLPSEVKQPKDAGHAILTSYPVFVGQPILAIAALTEQQAEAALEAVKNDLNPLGEKAKYVSSKRSNFKKGFSKNTILSISLIFNLLNSKTKLIALNGYEESCFILVNLSSCAAATIFPSIKIEAALS